MRSPDKRRRPDLEDRIRPVLAQWSATRCRAGDQGQHDRLEQDDLAIADSRDQCLTTQAINLNCGNYDLAIDGKSHQSD